MDKGAIFLLFFPLIVIIIRTASYWLHQQHRTRMYLYQAQIMLTLALFLHFLHSVAVILRFSVYIWFGFGLVFWTPFTRLLSLICLIFIMPFSTNVMSPSPCAPSIATIYMPKLKLVRWWLLHSWQGWSQWIVLKSVPNGNSNREKSSVIQKVSEALKKHTRT